MYNLKIVNRIIGYIEFKKTNIDYHSEPIIINVSKKRKNIHIEDIPDDELEYMNINKGTYIDINKKEKLLYKRINIIYSNYNHLILYV